MTNAHKDLGIVVDKDGAARANAALLWAARDATMRRDLSVLVGIDEPPVTAAATALAFDEASRCRVSLIALHAWSDVGVFHFLGMDWHTYHDDGAEVLSERLAGWRERHLDVTVERWRVCDRPTQWLRTEARGAQVVVVGSHGRGGFASMLLGSVSSAAAESVGVPVIVARGA